MLEKSIPMALVVTGASQGIGLGVVESILASHVQQQAKGVHESPAGSYFKELYSLNAKHLRYSWPFIVAVSRSGLCAALDKRFSPQVSDYLKKSVLIKDIKGALPDQNTVLSLVGAVQEVLNAGAQCICVVHNFAKTHMGSIEDTTYAAFSDIVEANVTLPFKLVKELSPLMPPGSQHIFLGSALSTQGATHSSAYAVSKHALLGLMRCAQIELAPKGIRCNFLAPMFVNTDMGREVLSHKWRMSSASHGAAPAPETLGDHLLSPYEVGEFIRFIAESPGISGEVLTMSGEQNSEVFKI